MITDHKQEVTPLSETVPSAPSAIEQEDQSNTTGVNLNEGIEYLVFVTIGRKLAVPITGVREIRGWSQPTPLPHSAEYLLGVVNLRGTVLPVIDLAQRLGLGLTPTIDRNVFVVIEIEGRPLGLLVEAVADIHTSAGEDHQPLPDTGQSDHGGCIDGLLISGDEMIQVLDPNALAAISEISEVVAS